MWCSEMRDSQGDSRPGGQRSHYPHPLPCPQLPSARRMCAGPHSSAVCPPAHASQPASTVMRRVTVQTEVMRLAAVSGEQGQGRFWAPLLLSVSPLSGTQLSSLGPSLPHSCSHLPSATTGGDPSTGVHSGFPGPDSDLHLCGHWCPHPHHQLATQLGSHPLTPQVRFSGS